MTPLDTTIDKITQSIEEVGTERSLVTMINEGLRADLEDFEPISKKVMGVIREPECADFVVESRPRTPEAENEIASGSPLDVTIRIK